MVMQQVCGTTKTGLKPKSVSSFAERQVCPAVPVASCLSLVPAAGEPVGQVSFPSVRGSPRANLFFSLQTWDTEGKSCVSSIRLRVLKDSVLSELRAR